jgi:hypothetical protein
VHDLNAVAELMGQIVRGAGSAEEAAEDIAALIYQMGLSAEELRHIKGKLQFILRNARER